MQPKLFLGDAISILPTIQTNSIELILSDVPYGIAVASWDVKHENKNSALLKCSPAQKDKPVFKTRGKPLFGWSKEDKLRGKSYFEFSKSYLTECCRILKPGGALVCFCGRQYQHYFTLACEESGFFLKDVLPWDKGSAPFRAQRITEVLKRRGKVTTDVAAELRLGNLAPQAEPIIWCAKSWKQPTATTDMFLTHGTGVFSSSVYKSNLIHCSSKIKNRVHPTQKPVELIKNLVLTFSLPSQTVLDMFMGSGTTGVAAAETDRNFIGIERDPIYFKQAQQRIRRHLTAMI